ncbi:hypothetical protein J6590_060052 [Homalodisca vitripennis]|nr:hypothetical protein J6590_060052 [Homalodisca vitripennis]
MLHMMLQETLNTQNQNFLSVGLQEHRQTTHTENSGGRELLDDYNFQRPVAQKATMSELREDSPRSGS